MFYCIPTKYSTCTHTRQMRRGTVTTCPRVCQVGRETCKIWTMHNYHINHSKEEKIRLPDTFTPAPKNPLICMINLFNLPLICRRFYVVTLIKNGAILRRNDAIQNKKLCDLEHEWCHWGHWENNVILWRIRKDRKAEVQVQRVSSLICSWTMKL